MIIKTQKVLLPFLLALLMLCIVLGLSINKTRLKEEVFTAIDTVMAQDWGFSGPADLYGRSALSEFGETPKQKMLGALKNLPNRILWRAPSILYSKATGFPVRLPIGRIDIDIKFKNYQKILADRKHALEVGMLRDPQEVPAKIRYKGEIYKAKIRLKGDLYSHWRSPVRMSFRVSLKGKKTIQGFKRFSLHKPGDRQYPHDQIFQDFVRENGVLASRHDFIRVFVNGQKWGVMNIEEHMSKELLEKQEAKDSIILKLGDERKWYYEVVTPLPYKDYRLSSLSFSTSVYQGKKYLSQPLARAHFSYVHKKFMEYEGQDILDIDSFSRVILAAAVWNDFHSLSTGNTRFYFNPYTLKIEPISADQNYFAAIEKEGYALSDLYFTDEIPDIYKMALFSPEGQKRFTLNLESVLQAAEKIPKFYAYYHSFFPNNYGTDIGPVMGNVEKIRHLEVEPIQSFLWQGRRDQNLTLPLEKLPPTSQQAASLPEHVYARHYDDGRLFLFNLLNVPVRLEEVLYDGKYLRLSDRTIPPYTQNNGRLVIATDKTGLHDNAFTVKTSYGGHLREVKSKATLVTSLFNPLEAENVSPDFPGFIEKSSEGYFVKAGNWNVLSPLLLDASLTIQPGATLNFSPDAYLIVKGRLFAQGLREEPITLKPIGKSWKGLYVLEARELSLLRHVVIADTSALQDGLLSLTGGVTFYKSPVEIEDTQIIGTIAEDALNIVKSDFVIKNSLVTNARSDAFDSDFSSGRIISSKFEKIGGDAVDFSGSQVLINGLTVNNVHDKAVSAGEGSTLTIENSVFTHVGVGIASKDGSVVTAKKITVSDYDLYAAMTYVKKDMFGPSELRISELNYDGTSPFSRQKGTTLFVDDKLIDAEKIDVKALYDSEVMRK